MGNWIAKRREEVGIESQEALANMLQLEGINVSRGTVGHWETERQSPPLESSEFRRALSKVLRMSIPAMLSAAGFEISIKYSDEALKGAEIIEQLPDHQKRLAISILEQILRGA